MAILATLNGCAAAAIGAAGAATAGTATSAVQERGIGGRAVDARIQNDINALWLGYNPNLLRWLDLKVYNRRVLVLGRAPSEEIRAEAIRLSWQPPGVREVINEVNIGHTVGYLRSTRDAAIATEIDSRLLLKKDLKNQNYTTRVLDGDVYVMGLSGSPQEKEQVLAIIRKVGGVKRVISYIE
jgi:osmotically-inducible protein OsmY